MGSEHDDFQTVFIEAGVTDTTQENIQDWLQLGEDPGLQLPASSKFLNKDSTVTVLFIFISTAYTCY
jgi:hypothetical protein